MPDRRYELKLADGRETSWVGASPEDAARRYVDAHPAAVVVAWREETSVVAVVHPSQIIG